MSERKRQERRKQERRRQERRRQERRRQERRRQERERGWEPQGRYSRVQGTGRRARGHGVGSPSVCRYLRVVWVLDWILQDGVDRDAVLGHDLRVGSQSVHKQR